MALKKYKWGNNSNYITLGVSASLMATFQKAVDRGYKMDKGIYYTTQEEAEKDGWVLISSGGTLDKENNPLIVYKRGLDIMHHKVVGETIKDAKCYISYKD